jgi:hypothetical protein
MLERMIRVALAAGLALSVAAAVPASAKSGDVVRTGSCSGSSDWKLKLSPEDGMIEVEYEVDSNKVGQTWRVRLFQNDVRIFAGSRVTQAPSGSFTVRVVASNKAGTDAFRARAQNVASGELCRGSASIG